MVLLGIRSALTDNNNCSAAELVHGTTLCLPGEFFTPPKVTTLLTQQAMLHNSSSYAAAASSLSLQTTSEKGACQ